MPAGAGYTRAMNGWGSVVAICLALACTSAAAAAPPNARGVRHCHDLPFSERLRAHGTGCEEARLVARRAVRHIENDPVAGWQVDSRIHGRRGRVWDCTGAGFNPLPLACRLGERWVKLQVWAD